MTATAEDIIAACESEWDEHKADCSGFVNAVAARLHVPLHGMANNIVTAISQPPWSRLPDGVEAAKSAAAGRFVVAGLQGSAQAAPPNTVTSSWLSKATWPMGNTPRPIGDTLAPSAARPRQSTWRGTSRTATG
jgi:hypothetical protein